MLTISREKTVTVKKPHPYSAPQSFIMIILFALLIQLPVLFKKHINISELQE